MNQPLPTHLPNDVIVRVLRKNDRNPVGVVSEVGRSLRIVHQTENGESSTTFHSPENTLEVSINQQVTIAPYSLVVALEPSEVLIESQILVQSSEWLGGRLFSACLPKDPGLARGLNIIISASQPDVFTTVIFREPGSVYNGIAELHLLANRSGEPRAEVVECHFGTPTKAHVYHLREPIPRSRYFEIESNHRGIGQSRSNQRGHQPAPTDSGFVEGSTSKTGTKNNDTRNESPKSAATRRDHEGGPGNPLEELRQCTNSFTRVGPIYANVGSATATDSQTRQVGVTMPQLRRIPGSRQLNQAQPSNILVQTSTSGSTTRSQTRGRPVSFHGASNSSTEANHDYHPDFSVYEFTDL